MNQLMNALIQIAAALVGTLGFGFLFNSRGKKLVFAAVGGMLSWSVFLALGIIMENEVLRYFIVSLLTAGYAEILARLIKTPASTFCMLSLLPLVPGSALYSAASAAISSDFELFADRAVYTLSLAVALSLGIIITTAFTKLLAAARGTSHTAQG